MNLKHRITRILSKVLLCSMLLQGCTTYYTVERAKTADSVDEINAKAESNDILIERIDGNSYSGKNIMFTPDSLFWYQGKIDDSYAYPNADINKITVINRLEGAGRGMGIGACIGLGILFVAQIFSADFLGEGDNMDTAKIYLGAVIAGAIVGMPIGYTQGNRYVYTFTGQEQFQNGE